MPFFGSVPFNLKAPSYDIVSRIFSSSDILRRIVYGDRALITVKTHDPGT